MVFKSVFKEVERDLELCKVQKIGKKGINLSNNYFIVSFFAVRKYKLSIREMVLPSPWVLPLRQQYSHTVHRLTVGILPKTILHHSGYSRACSR